MAAQDLVVANRYTSTVSVLLAKEGGPFDRPIAYEVHSGVSSVAVADLNRDGSLDLLAASQAQGRVHVLLGHKRNGQFRDQPAMRRVVTPML